jgi:hypothetical protein
MEARAMSAPFFVHGARKTVEALRALSDERGKHRFNLDSFPLLVHELSIAVSTTS